MAITINPEISGQVITPACSYCYLFEPLRVVLLDDNPLSTLFFIDISIIDTTDSSVQVAFESKYAIYDINSGVALSVDLMELARQYHDADVYKYQSTTEMTDSVSGWQSVVSKYKYEFRIYTDYTVAETIVTKLPIIGGRTLKNFVPLVDESQVLTEAELYGVQLKGRWIGYPTFDSQLALATAVDSSPIITTNIEDEGCAADGGFLVFKSRFGSWMIWGMDIATESESGSYSGNISSGMFKSTEEINGSPYIGVNYTEVMSSYTISTKALSLSKEDLMAVSGIHSTPALYYKRTVTSPLELVRKTSSSTPITSLSSGGDFSVSMKSISETKQKTR